ncbi:Alcohol acetyltransferase [Penicillium angulare]|uniref:Alcohol acetyltransferase n=1 Tax=Penicillium angulare TaxID=116970 RepID=UPI00253FE8B9|nr:Alcohol acetyltransferase [Penicillium angulare]KAJ5266560.1 Alcohol acetyltransferase [Penicillium angulare]
MIYFYRQSEKKKSQHRSFSGVLPQINLDKHVEFIEIPAEDERAGLTATIQRYHSLWFDPSEKPLWKLVIVNGRHALFVFDHFVTDGRGSTYILESLLEALNSPNEKDGDSPIVDITTEIKGYPERDPVKCSGKGPSVLFAIMSYVTFWCLQLFYRGTDIFFHDAVYQERELVFSDPKKEDNLTVTNLHTLRLDADTMHRCLKACREHQTSFTSFLHTLIKVTLAADFYPKAKFSHSETVIDSEIPVDADTIWKIARKHKAHISNDLQHKKSWMKAWQAIDLIGEDEEDYVSQFAPGLKLVQKYAFNVSNLGAFENQAGSGPWNISNMEFSAGAIKAGYGVNLSFNVSGVRDGVTVVHVNSEEGSLPSDFVASLVSRIEKRMLAVI